MSAGYAGRLSEYAHKGAVGLPERFDSKRQLKLKLSRLTKLVQEAKHLVFLTGAGISTSAGIPDFRGPKGIWTLEAKLIKNRKRKRQGDSNPEAQLDAKDASACMDFSVAKPTFTHRAITKLAKAGILKYCITQNVDGLHRRAGLSRDCHSALHGCVFTEKCHTCHAEFFRDEDVGGMSFRPTGKYCDICGGMLHDTLLDWEDPLPYDDLHRAEKECALADLVVCLGTSLRIEPVGSLPLRSKCFVIVNLQETPKDGDAFMTVRAPVDYVMESLMGELELELMDEGNSMIERVWTPRATGNALQHGEC